jgi:hypothetical protein
MAAIGGDDELGFGPFTVQRPGAFHGADHIVTALHDDTGDVANPRGVAEQLVVRFQKALVGKVVGLNTREGESELILLVAAGKCRIGQQLRGGAFPTAPDSRRDEPHGGILAGEAPIVGRQQIAALALGNMGEVRLPCIRIENGSAALVEPVDLLLAEQEDAAHNEFGHTLRVRLGIGESQGGAPGSSENLPSLDSQVLADLFNIADEVPGGVGFESCVGCALAAASLVKVNDAVFFRVEEAALLGIGTAARTAVQKNYRLTGRVAALLEVELVDRRHLEPARAVGLNRRVEPGERILHDGNRVVGHVEQYISRVAPALRSRRTIGGHGWRLISVLDT